MLEIASSEKRRAQTRGQPGVTTGESSVAQWTDVADTRSLGLKHELVAILLRGMRKVAAFAPIIPYVVQRQWTRG